MLSLDLSCFKDPKDFLGWIVSPNYDEEMPDTVSDNTYCQSLRYIYVDINERNRHCEIEGRM